MLRSRGAWDQIDEVVWADERDESSPGMQLARQHDVQLAPFFIVREEDGTERAETSTLKIVKLLAKAPRVSTPQAEGNVRAPSPPSAEEVKALSGELSGRPPREVLAWGLKRYGADLSIAFSGAEDVALIDMAARLELPFGVFCLDTGRLHEETYRFIDRVRAFYGVEVKLFTPQTAALQAFVRKRGLFSFFEDGHGECCGVRKIEPLKRALSDCRAWATGQRRDQSPATRSSVNVIELDTSFTGQGGEKLVKLNPLAHFSSAQVWEYIREHDVPYNELHDHGFVSIGCQPCTRPARPGEPERASRWWWEDATKRECGLHAKKA